MSDSLLYYKLSTKFFKRYFKEFASSFILPFLLYMIAAFITGFTITFLPVILIITLPLMFYSLWKIFIISFAVIPASYEFLKNGAKKSFKEIITEVNQKELIKYLGFSCSVFLLPILVFILNLLFNSSLNSNNFVFIISTLISLIFIIPYSLLYLQAFYHAFQRFEFSLRRLLYLKLEISYLQT